MSEHEKLCECGCGLTPSRSKSTGNLLRYVRGHWTIQQNKTHGMSNTPTYRAWRHMMVRCHNQNCADYNDYGGRGIKVCERWQKFRNFYADMGQRPEGKTLDRYPDNDGNYEPGNCRWASLVEQANNKRSNVLVEHIGKAQTLPEWARELRMNYHSLFTRFQRGDRSPRLFRPL